MAGATEQGLCVIRAETGFVEIFERPTAENRWRWFWCCWCGHWQRIDHGQINESDEASRLVHHELPGGRP